MVELLLDLGDQARYGGGGDREEEDDAGDRPNRSAMAPAPIPARVCQSAV